MGRLCWADGRDGIVRVVLPMLVLWGLIVGFGLAVVGPLADPLNAEDAINRGLAVHRSGAGDSVTFVWSFLGSTQAIAGVCLVVSAALLWHTRDWRLTIVPAMAVLLQLSMYLTVTALIHRERPSVERLDALPAMSSYPSGHVGASAALYLSLILLASRCRRAGVRWVMTAVCGIIPLLVASSRVYRGVHHVSDVVVGMVGGAGCALLAYRWYLHRVRSGTAPSGAELPDSER